VGNLSLTALFCRPVGGRGLRERRANESVESNGDGILVIADSILQQ